MKTIKFYRKNVYGNELMYIADKETAELVSTLTGRKTLLQQDIDVLTKLGFSFEETLPVR